MNGRKKEKKTELENQLGFMHKIIPSNKKDERRGEGKIASTFLLLHGTGGNEEDLIPMACNISSETTIINPRGKLLDNGIAVQFS
jgi:phospholipase/carboxylesterase